MEYYNKENYIKTINLLQKIPFNVESFEKDINYIYFECTTLRNGFGFQVYVDNSGYVDLHFDPSLYGNEDLINCDFRNDLDFNEYMNSFGYDLSTENVKSFFEKHFEEICQYYIYKNNIENKNTLQNTYNLEISTLLNLLKKDNSEFNNIESWVSNCYAVSNAIYKYIDIDNLELVYGKWFGFVSKKSHFDQGISNHGWLEFKLNNKTIVIDPTRWVFENVEPYIYINIKGIEYDRAGQRFNEIIKKSNPIPEKNEKDEIINISFGKEIDTFLLDNILEGKYKKYTVKILLYIANLPISLLEPHTTSIFNILIENGLNYMIPIDTKELIFGYNNDNK